VDRKAVGVVEAKKEGTTLSMVAEQSSHYGVNLPDFIQAIAAGSLPFLYESTGTGVLFRDECDPDPRSRWIFSFHRPETLAEWLTQPDTLQKAFTGELPG
jgi:type I restriction enzyme R subunit